MRTITISLFGFVAFSMALFNVATGAPIVSNNSFETPARENDNPAYTTTDPPGWTSSGFAVGGDGVDNIAGASLSGGNGQQYFYGDGANPAEVLYQDLGVPFAPATKYTVDLLGAYRSNCCGSSGVNFGVDSSSQAPGTALAGATVGHISLTDEENAGGAFIAASVGANSNEFTFTTGAVVPTGDIVAYIGSDGNFATNGGRLTVDDFVLTATMVPEPSSIVAILGVCAMGLIGVLRFRLRRQPSRA